MFRVTVVYKDLTDTPILVESTQKTLLACWRDIQDIADSDTCDLIITATIQHMYPYVI